MTLKEFLLTKTQVGELCVITDSGWIIATCWIDHEDLFIIPESLRECKVDYEQWGIIRLTNKQGGKEEVSCHQIAIIR